MNFKLVCIVLIVFCNELIFAQHSSSSKKSKVDNRLICVKGRKGAKLKEIDFVGITKSSTNLIQFLKQFKPPHVLPKDDNKSWVGPKFISGTLNAIAKRECRKFDKTKQKPSKNEVYGIIFLNGNQLYSLFHDQDFKWNGALSQLKYTWDELEDFE